MRLSLLIIGGYGFFGARLVNLLSRDRRLTIIVAGRSLHKAEACAAACEGPAVLVPAVVDRDENLDAAIARYNPDYVIDASGPWQDYGDDAYRVAEAAISAGAGYLDLADSSRFVNSIDVLDAQARNAGVPVISGLSTCPALSSAVVDRLSRDFARVDRIAGGIAPSPFAGMGLSVIEAIASYAGKPVRRYRDGALATDYAFVDTRRFTVAPPGAVPLPSLVFSLIDVPDLDMGRKGRCEFADTWFGVSTRPAIYHALLRFLVRFVKLGWIGSIKPLGRIMHFVSNRLTWGEHRGGMFVELCGSGKDGMPLTKSWHLIAERDTGPNIPVLGVVALLRAHLDGRPPPPGARSAAGALALSTIEPLLHSLRICTGTREDHGVTDQPLFRRVIGSQWTELPESIRVIHGGARNSVFAGRATVTRGRSFLSRVLGRVVGMPAAAADTPVSVTIDASDGVERWTRDFDGHLFSSVHSLGSGRMHRLVCERIGPLRLGMALAWDGARLRYSVRRWSFLGLPIPLFLAPAGDISEFVDDGRFNFHVEVHIPVVGHVVTYKGWLEPDA